MLLELKYGAILRADIEQNNYDTKRSQMNIAIITPSAFMDEGGGYCPAESASGYVSTIEEIEALEHELDTLKQILLKPTQE